MDSLHFYVFQLITSVLRMYTKPDSNDDDEDDNDADDDEHPPYFDRSLSRMSKVLRNCKERKNNDNVTDIVIDDNDDYTFLDLTYQHWLLSNKTFIIIK